MRSVLTLKQLVFSKTYNHNKGLLENRTKGTVPFWKFLALLTVCSAALIEAASFVRTPYLQLGAPTSASICWRVDVASVLTVRYGKDSSDLKSVSTASPNSTNACVSLTGLSPATKYYYQVYDGNTRLAGTSEQYFVTHPPVGEKGAYKFWIIGDAGTLYSEQFAVRDAFLSINKGPHTDGFIMLGDNAYENGTDSELTKKMFNVYPTIMSSTFTWSCIGNHESYTSKGAPYLDAFNFPTQGQSGGVASNTELYYSYDYGNIHFISLASIVASRSATGPQMEWLKQDLQATRQEWIVVYFHHPPYTWGSHNSDTEKEHIEMRQNFLPVLEQYGVDIVYGGHSHNYERSFLLDSAYGNSTDNKNKSNRVILDKRSGNPATTGPYIKTSKTAGHKGTVYVVDGSSGKVSPIKGLHPMHYIQLRVEGSVILTINDTVATHKFYDKSGKLLDEFQLIQRDSPTLVNSSKKSASEFKYSGRTFWFSEKNQTEFFVYSIRGQMVMRKVPKGKLLIDSKMLPSGKYYYRFASAYGKIDLQ